MNKHNLPWLRDDDFEETVETQSSFLTNCLIVFIFIGVSWLIALTFLDGLNQSAVIAEREAKAKQRGRVEMLAEVNAAFEKEGRTLETYYRWASRKGTTGFDGLVLAENKEQ